MTELTTTSPDKFIEVGLKKFEESQITKESLIALADSVKDLEIKDVNDKEGARKVSEGRKMLKKKRVEIKKTADEIREDAKKFNQAVIAREKELTSLIEPTEEILEAKETKYNEEVERIRQEEERKKADKINARIKALNDFNYAVDITIITQMTDEKFEDVLREAKDLFEKSEKIRIMEEEKKAEFKRQEDEKAALLKKQEEERLENERKELETQKAKQAKINGRISKLVKLGFQWNEKWSTYNLEVGTLSGVIGIEQIEIYSDEEFDKFYFDSVEGFTKERERLDEIERKKKEAFEEEQRLIREENERKRKELEDREAELKRQEDEKIAAAKAEQDRISNLRTTQLINLGLKFDGDSFIFEKEDVVINFHNSDILSYDQIKWDNEFQKAASAISELNSRIKERQEKEKIEKDRIESEQKMLFGEDSDRFASLNKSFDAFIENAKELQHMKSEQGKKVASDIESLVYQASALCKRQLITDGDATAV